MLQLLLASMVRPVPNSLAVGVRSYVLCLGRWNMVKRWRLFSFFYFQQTEATILHLRVWLGSLAIWCGAGNQGHSNDSASKIDCHNSAQNLSCFLSKSTWSVQTYHLVSQINFLYWAGSQIWNFENVPYLVSQCCSWNSIMPLCEQRVQQPISSFSVILFWKPHWRCKAVEKSRLFNLQQTGDRLRALKEIQHPMLSSVHETWFWSMLGVMSVTDLHSEETWDGKVQNLLSL